MLWGATATISDLTRHGAFPQVAVDLNGNALALWYSYDVDVTDTIFSNVATSAAYLPYGGSWTSPTVVSEAQIRDPADLEIQVAF